MRAIQLGRYIYNLPGSLYVVAETCSKLPITKGQQFGTRRPGQCTPTSKTEDGTYIVMSVTSFRCITQHSGMSSSRIRKVLGRSLCLSLCTTDIDLSLIITGALASYMYCQFSGATGRRVLPDIHKVFLICFGSTLWSLRTTGTRRVCWLCSHQPVRIITATTAGSDKGLWIQQEQTTTGPSSRAKWAGRPKTSSHMCGGGRGELLILNCCSVEFLASWV